MSWVAPASYGTFVTSGDPQVAERAIRTRLISVIGALNQLAKMGVVPRPAPAAAGTSPRRGQSAAPIAGNLLVTYRSQMFTFRSTRQSSLRCQRWLPASQLPR
jgi:hypothetical protein